MLIRKRQKPPRARVRSVRYKDEEWALIKERAALEGISPGTFVREISLAVAKVEIEGHRAATGQDDHA